MRTAKTTKDPLPALPTLKTLGAILILLGTLGTASASTHACLSQTSVPLTACFFVGTFQNGDASCETTGSWSAGGAWVGAGVGDEQRGIAADNGCYAYAYEGQPYEGSQIAFHLWQAGPDGYEDDGFYLNSGTFHSPGGDHRYCYVAQLDENGEDQDGLRIDCPVPVPVPTPLRWLP